MSGAGTTGFTDRGQLYYRKPLLSKPLKMAPEVGLGTQIFNFIGILREFSVQIHFATLQVHYPTLSFHSPTAQFTARLQRAIGRISFFGKMT